MNWKRIFEDLDGNIDSDKTIQHIRDVLNLSVWTETLDTAFDSLLCGETTKDMAERLGIEKVVAIYRHDMAVYTLRKMAREGLIAPILEGEES